MDQLDGLLSSLHDHLAATAELSTEANRWLGEAQSLSEDLAGDAVDHESAQERIETVLDLLDKVDDTGNEEANEHVEAARRAAERALDRLAE